MRNSGAVVHTSPDYPNNAYFAVEGRGHHPHEIETARILAENGGDYEMQLTIPET